MKMKLRTIAVSFAVLLAAGSYATWILCRNDCNPGNVPNCPDGCYGMVITMGTPCAWWKGTVGGIEHCLEYSWGESYCTCGPNPQGGGYNMPPTEYEPASCEGDWQGCNSFGL